MRKPEPVFGILGESNDQSFIVSQNIAAFYNYGNGVCTG
jgi:hypothetical protein